MAKIKPTQGRDNPPAGVNTPEENLQFVDWANANGRDVHDPAAMQYWRTNLAARYPPLSAEQRDFAHGADAYFKIGRMVDPQKFDAAVQAMPMPTSEIIDLRQPEAGGKGPDDPIKEFLNYQAPAKLKPQKFSGTLEDFIAPPGGDKTNPTGPPMDNFHAANEALQLTPQEQSLYKLHLDNLYGSGGVDNPPTADNPEGSRSSLYQTSFEHSDGRTYNVPTVSEGKILDPNVAIDKAIAEGIHNYPSYGSQDEAERRYQQMHDFMEQDTAKYRQQLNSPPNDYIFNPPENQ